MEAGLQGRRCGSSFYAGEYADGDGGVRPSTPQHMAMAVRAARRIKLVDIGRQFDALGQIAVQGWIIIRGHQLSLLTGEMSQLCCVDSFSLESLRWAAAAVRRGVTTLATRPVGESRSEDYVCCCGGGSYTRT